MSGKRKIRRANQRKEAKKHAEDRLTIAQATVHVMQLLNQLPLSERINVAWRIVRGKA